MAAQGGDEGNDSDISTDSESDYDMSPIKTLPGNESLKITKETIPEIEIQPFFENTSESGIEIEIQVHQEQDPIPENEKPSITFCSVKVRKLLISKLEVTHPHYSSVLKAPKTNFSISLDTQFAAGRNVNPRKQLF